MPLTLENIRDRLERLEKITDRNGNPFCKRRVFESYTWRTDSYCLEITSGVKDKPAELANVTIDANKRGVLLIAGLLGNEVTSVEGLLCAAEALIAAFLLHDACNGQGALTIPINGGQLNVQDIGNIQTKLDILIVPVVNRPGYAAGTRGCGGVDLARDFPVLWNGRRYDTGAKDWKDYFANNQMPPGWNGANPGLDSKPASQDETKSVMKLMRKQIDAFVDFQDGYEEQILYPWSFWRNSPDQSHPEWRYCNPGFATHPEKPNGGGTNPYVEFMPTVALANQVAAAQAMITELRAAGTTFVAHQGCFVRHDLPAPAIGFAPPQDDPSGGICIDYCFSLDPCRIVSLLVEAGRGSRTQREVTRNVQACVFGILKHMLSVTTPVRRVTTTTDWAAEIAADWTRGQTNGW